MAADQASRGVSVRRRTFSDSIAQWSLVAAVLLGVAALADFARWGNRWYITEVFARDVGGPGGVTWDVLYGMLHHAHEALVRGLVLLLFAAAFASITAVIQRRAAR